VSAFLLHEDTRTRPSEEARRGTRESGDSGQRPIRVVVGEDSYPIREFLTMILSSAPGVELVAVCSDGNELRKAIAASSPDVVVH